MDDRERREVVKELIQVALAAADPAQAVCRHVKMEKAERGAVLQVGDRHYSMVDGTRVFVVGAGKAGARMAEAIEPILGDWLGAGWVNVREDHRSRAQRIHVHPAGHPLPDASGLEGTRRMLSMLEGLTEQDVVLVLLSGGASALLEQPVTGVTLEDLRHLTTLLLRSGATIAEMNAVRKHLSQVKGGQLARHAAPAPTVVLVLSDVVGSPFEVIGSGPCAPDPTTFADAWAVLEHHGLVDELPRSVLIHLQRGQQGLVPDTPKPGDPLFEHVQHLLIGDNRMAAQAVLERARESGLNSFLLTSFMEGEADEVGRMLAALAKEEARYGQPLPRPACLILGGETTVTVRGMGQGGRNQQVALSAALALDGWTDLLVATLSTDGVDGPTDAAGAIATGETAARARELGLNPYGHMVGNNAYPFFSALGDLIRTGPTGTNVNDLAFVLVG